MRTVVFLVAVTVALAITVVGDTLSAELGNCAAEAKAATAQCQAQVAKAKGLADKACKGRNYEEVMKKVARLKRLAEKQEAALKRGEKALAAARAQAAKLAKLSGKERAKLLAELAKQKGGKKTLSDAEKKAAQEDASMKHLRGQADAAMQKAVEIAKTTGEKGKVRAAKDKAHALYRKMVDEKIRVAGVHHKVVTAKKELAKISAEVEKEIAAAKKVAQKEAGALKTVALDREKVADSKLKETQNKAGSASLAANSAERKEKGLLRKSGKAQQDIVNGRATVNNAQQVENQAKKAEGVVKGTKVQVGPLKMKELKEKAKAIAAGRTPAPSQQSVDRPPPQAAKQATVKHETSGGAAHVHVYVHSHGASPDAHKAYADKVKKLEKERLAAKAVYHSAEAKLARLKQSGASAEQISEAQNNVNVAAANVKKLVAAQHAAVMTAVNAVKGGGGL